MSDTNAFIVTAPDGKEYEITAPKGATQEQALDYFKRNWKPEAAPKKDAPKQAPAQEPSLLARAGRAIDDAVRGAADTLTFGYADEIAAKLDQLTGANTSGKSVAPNATYDERLAAQRARDAEGGTAQTVGQIAGALVPARRIAGAADALMKLGKVAPTTTKTAAATGAISGGLYGTGSADGDLTDRAIGGVLGATTGGALGAAGGKLFDKVTDAVPTLRADKMAQKPYAQIDAEIVQDLAAIKGSATSGGDLIVKQRNALGTKYIDEVKDSLKEAGVKLTPEMQAAIKQRHIITPEALDNLRATPGGEAVAEAVTKYQRLMEITKPEAASGSVAKVVRGLIDWTPLPKPVNQAIQSVLGSRVTAEQKLQDLLTNPNVKASQLITERLGPSSAAAANDRLGNLAQQNALNIAMKAAEAQKAQAATQAQAQATRNEVLRDTRMPLSGAFQELLPGGRSGLNLSTDEAIQGLRLLSRKGGTVGDGAKQILKSPKELLNDDVFYGVQNALRKLQEKGVVGTAPVKNPEKYQAATIANAIKEALNPNQGALSAATKEAAPTFTSAQKQALDTYVESSGPFNDYLRGEGPGIGEAGKQVVKQLDSLFTSAPKLDKETIVYRAVPDFVYNGKNSVDKGFVSVTRSKAEAEKFMQEYDLDKIVEIKLPKGTPLVEPGKLYPGYAYQDEILLPRNGTFVGEGNSKIFKHTKGE